TAGFRGERIEGHGAASFADGFLGTAQWSQNMVAEEGVRSRIVWIQGDRSPQGPFGLREGVVPTLDESKRGVGLREIGIEQQRFFDSGRCLLMRLRIRLEVHIPQKEGVADPGI